MPLRAKCGVVKRWTSFSIGTGSGPRLPLEVGVRRILGEITKRFVNVVKVLHDGLRTLWPFLI